jgi:hypothetical protein
MASFGHGAIKHAPDAGSPQIKSLRKRIKCRSDQLLPFLAELTVEAGMIVRAHAALEDHRLIGAIKEPRRDAQCTDPVASKPSGTNLVSLGLHAVHRWRKYANRTGDVL